MRRKQQKNRVNPLLTLWDETRRRAAGPALRGGDGSVLRTWDEIEAEARAFEARFDTAAPRVAVQAANHPSYPALLLAVWRAGGAVCLLDPATAPPRRAVVVRETGCDFFVDDTWRFARTGTPGSETDSACLYKVTSGTTGEPKVIGFTGAQLAADARQIVAGMGIGPDDVNLAAVSFAHSYGLSSLVTPLLAHAVPAVIAGDALGLAGAIRAGGATVLPLVPAMFRALAAGGVLPDSVRLCISAGAPLDPAVAGRFHARHGRKIHSFYGSSECGGICFDASPDPVREPGFVGLPLPGVELTFAGPESPAGTAVRVRGPAVGCLVGGVFEPPDLLVRCGDGFRIVGRTGEMINVGGRKVSPVEVEAVLLAHPAVSDAAVAAGERAGGDGTVVAYVCAVEPLEEQDLRRFCAARLAAWQVPREIRFVPSIPRNARGKIVRNELGRI